MILLLFQRWFAKRPAARTGSAGLPIEEEVAAIRMGDGRLREDVLARYQPYVAKVCSRFCKRYIHPESDDEFSIALAAFNEAIDAYDERAGRSFLSFAETVIRRRLTDYVRKERRHAASVPHSFQLSGDEDGGALDRIDARASVEHFRISDENEERRLEIEALNRELAEYGITFADLAEGSPKHEDARRSLLAIGALISRSEELHGPLRSKKTLPMKELAERVPVSRKTLERGRKYIIAVALIHLGPYPHLKEYVADPAGRDADAGTGSDARRGFGAMAQSDAGADSGGASGADGGSDANGNSGADRRWEA